MEQIKNLKLFVGRKEEYQSAVQRGMSIVCALNRADGFQTHQSVVGWKGRGCDPSSPYYLFIRYQDEIYLNMIDAEDPKYISDIMINAALDFIHKHLSNDKEVFIYCSLGESRSPSLALIYLLEYGLIERSQDTFNIFKNEYYPFYNPKMGNLLYIRRRFMI